VLKRYKSIFRTPWVFSDEFTDIPEKIRKSMLEKMAVDEPISMAAYTDSFWMRGAFYFIVTRDRIISDRATVRDECLLVDIKQIENHFGSITIETLVSKFPLWRASTQPNRHMVRDVHQKITNQWLQARRQVGTMSPTGTIKVCRFCAEDIKAAAVKCKHCGSNVE